MFLNNDNAIQGTANVPKYAPTYLSHYPQESTSCSKSSLEPKELVQGACDECFTPRCLSPYAPRVTRQCLQIIKQRVSYDVSTPRS